MTGERGIVPQWRIALYMEAFAREGRRITESLDFVAAGDGR